MVSVIGYSLGEILFALILSYVLLFLVVIVRYMRIVLDREENGKGNIWPVFAIAIGGSLLLTVIYWFPVRIGTVTFVMGSIFSWCVFELIDVFGRWSPFSVGGSNG
jgi:hypothetical protein